MKRVLVIGSGGAGKSTFARQLGEITGLPVIHLDAEYWRPGWVEPPKAEWAARVAQLAGEERWIMDGNYGGTMPERIAAADTVVFLDLPRTTCLWSVLKRRFRYRGRARPDMTEGCDERLTLAFLKWVWDYPKTRRPAILVSLRRARADGTRVIRLRTRKAMARFLAGLADEADGATAAG